MKKEKIINFKKYEDFKKDLEAGELLDTSIIFIDDLPGIYTHGTLFYCSSKPIIPGELAPDPDEPEPEKQIYTVTFEFDEGVKDIELYGKTITKNSITFSGETVDIEEGQYITWMANLKDGYEKVSNCDGNKQINQNETISMSTKKSWDGKHPVTFIFDEGIDYLTLSSKTIYYDKITYSGEVYRVKEGELLYWRPTYKEGYENQDNCSGQMYINQAETITMSTQKIPDPTTIPEAIDLGLSVLWADRNLGATADYEAGDYYVWGNIEPYETDPEYKMGTEDDITLSPEQDAARVKLGNGWRMPTKEEIEELMTLTPKFLKSYNGGMAMQLSGNGNSIVFPYKGALTDKGVLYGTNACHCWSSDASYNPYIWGFYCMWQYDRIDSTVAGATRGYALPIRPVKDKD